MFSVANEYTSIFMSAIFTRDFKLRLTDIVVFLACLTHVAMGEAGCGRPPEKPNAHHNATDDTYQHRSLVRYTCQKGFFQKGYPAVICNEGVWYGHPQAPFTCQLGSCQSPGLIDNGDRDGFVFSVGATVKYTCHEGFEIKGSAVRLCLASFTWSGKKPSCVPVRCPRLSPPKHGKVQPDGLEFGATARVICDEGFRLVGPETRSCQGDKTWSGEGNSCKEIECAKPMLEYGSVTVKTPIKYGDIAIFSCEAGRTLIGKKTAFCVGDNKWSQKIPACIDTCEVPRVSKGDVRQLNEDYYSYARYTRFYEDRVESGMSLYVKCEWRYSLIPEANTYEGYRKMTCVDGAWDSEPKCEPKSCEQTPSQLNHGITTFDGLEHGSRIRYSCDPGYTLSYYQNRTCVYGRWTGRKPWCKKNYCSYPKDLPLGMEVMDDSTATRFEHDAILKLQCRKGYRTVHKGISPQLTCYNTTWEINGNLQCESEPCFYEAKRFEEVISQTYTEDGKLSHNSTLEIRCKYPRRFHLKDGVSKARCHYGEWQPRVPSCEAESCELLESITHGRIIYSDDDTARVTKRVPHQATAKLVCDMGYRIAKNNMTHCVYGRWSPSSALACDPESCQGYDDLGRAGGYPASDGDIRQVFCPRGYHIDKLTIDGEFLYTRNVTAECSLGEWRPMVPECKPDPCKLPSWGNVDMRYENGTGDVDVIVSHDINVTFSCVDGYVWENETTDITDLSLSCQSGEWIGPLPPKCIPDGTGCLDPGDIQNANKTNVRIADNGYYPSGELLTYECHKGFLVDGMIRNQEIFCLGNGTWSDSLFNCTALTCDKPESIKDGSYSPVKELYFFNESVTYSCENPKTVSGSEILTCTEDGQWNKWKPECKVPKCPDLPWPEKGRRVGSGRQVGDIVSFECNAGYSVHGSKARTCQTNKEWSGEITTCVADLDQCVIPKEGKDVRSVYHDVGKHSLDVRMGDRVKEGTVMLSRCERFTDMYFIGDPKRVCEHGQWIGVEPKCTYTYLTEGAYSRRYYHEVSRPARGISISDEGHLEVRKGSTVILTCRFGEEQVWSSMKGLHSAEMVEKPVEYYADGGRKIVSSKLRITDADSHHSDTYFCSRSRRSIPTGTFTITVT